MKNKSLYNKDSIESLDPLSFVRLKPGVYCGSTAYSTQLLIEIVSNAIDEAALGHGTKIIITNKDGKTSCRDYGQGFLINEKREDGKTILEASFSVLNTSGKYRQDGVYEGTSLGNFGIGSKLQCYLSSESNVTSYRDGKFETIHFKDGVFQSREVGKTTEPNGTYVEWYPDPQFFDSVDIEESKIIPYLRTLTCLIDNLEIQYNDKFFKAKNGLNDLVDDYVKDNEIINKRFNLNFSEGKNKLDLIFTYTSNYSSTMVPYVNTGLTERGPHMAQIKAMITREFNKFFREKKWLKEKDDNLGGDDIQEGMYIVFNITTSGVTYDAQVKSTVTRLDMSPFSAAIVEAINNWLNANEKEIKVVADKALNARKAREAARKARDAARTVGEKKTKKALKFASKLADASSKNRSECEIYITEGDSASGNLKLARNNETQAILPVRGKIINCRKASLEKLQKNAEIMTMIEAFGLTADPKTLKLTFKPEDLRYGKIIIMSDADVDGAHIKNLFYTFIWTFCPALIEQGYVYAGVPPLYRVTENKDKYVYLKDDVALEEYRAAHPGKKLVLTRMKGLGEMDVDETKILVEPDQRIINQVTVEDIEQTNKLFEDLMGESILPRKNFIKEHSAEATYQI